MQGEGAGPESWLSGLELHSPSQVLVKANTSTLRNRWHRWSALNPVGVGSRIDPEQEVAHTLDSCPPQWTTYAVCKDNLGVNDCVIGMDEKVIVDRLDAGFEDESTSPTYLPLSCVSHSGSDHEACDREDGRYSK